MKRRFLIGISTLLILFIFINMIHKKFYTVEVIEIVNQPIEHVWRILAEEYGNIDKYSDKITNVELVNNEPIGFGCVRKCTLDDGGYMIEEITQWTTNKTLEITIKDSSLPMEPGTNVVFNLTEINGTVLIKAVGNYRVKYLGILSPIIAKKKYEKLLKYLISLTVKDNS